MFEFLLSLSFCPAVLVRLIRYTGVEDVLTVNAAATGLSIAP